MEDEALTGTARPVGRLLRHDLTAPLLTLAVCLFPFCATFLLFYPDERFYLDASLAMYQTGDVMVPRFDDGTPRLNKPVLTYWIMLVSYHVFGVHLLAARLPFLLSGFAVVWFTHRLALLITGQRRVAQLAVWIVVANPLFWLSCTRCLPDILLALFALMAIYGYFAWRANPASRAAGWFLGLGLGLAIGVKGLPALLLIGCIGLHAWRNRREIPIVLTRTQSLALLVGAAIGVLGFAPIVWNHAGETAAEIWRDQFASRLAGKTWGILYRLPLLLATLAGLHLAWLAPCALHLGRAIGKLRPRTAWHSFLALTAVLWLGATAATENCSIRYLFPLFPWLAVALAEGVAQCDGALLDRYSRRLLAVLAALVLILAGVEFVIALQLAARAWSVPALLLAAALAIFFFAAARRSDVWRRFATASALGPMALLTGFCAAAPLVLPDLGTQVTRSLDSALSGHDTVAVCGSGCQTTRVRLALAPRHTAVQRADEPATSKHVLLLSNAQMARLRAQDYEIHPAANMFEHISWREFIGAAGRGELGSLLQSQATVYWWAAPRLTVIH